MWEVDSRENLNIRLAPMSDNLAQTQQGRPSGQDVSRANRRLGMAWVLFPLVVVAVLVVVFGPKFELG